MSNPEILVLIIVALLVVGVITALVHGGHFKGRAHLNSAEIEMESRRDIDPHRGEAKIRRSKARGDIMAAGSTKATIDRTEAGGDMTARAGQPSDRVD